MSYNGPPGWTPPPPPPYGANMANMPPQVRRGGAPRGSAERCTFSDRVVRPSHARNDRPPRDPTPRARPARPRARGADPRPRTFAPRERALTLRAPPSPPRSPQGMYHPSSMVGYPYGVRGISPQAMQNMMYGPRVPSNPGAQYVDYETMYRDMQLRMYAAQQQQQQQHSQQQHSHQQQHSQQQQQQQANPLLSVGSPASAPGAHAHSPTHMHQPPLPPGRMPDGAMPPLTVPLTAEALREYQAAQMAAGNAGYGLSAPSRDGSSEGYPGARGAGGSAGGAGVGGWEDLGEEEDPGSVGSEGGKQSVARRRHARRRRQLARLAADRLEWEVRSRQMEAALLERSGGAPLPPGAAPEPSLSLFADFRKALARALLIADDAVERDADAGTYTESVNTGTNGEESAMTSDSEGIATRLVDEIRALDPDQSDDGGEEERASHGEATARGTGEAPENDSGSPSGPSGRKHWEEERGSGAASGERVSLESSQSEPRTPKRRSFEKRRADAGTASVAFATYLSSFAPRPEGWMTSSVSGGAFDPQCAGLEGVVALEHGLLRAQESGLFAPGELLITAVSTRNMQVCYAGSGCKDVLGASAEALIRTSLLDGLHAEDVRNLVFAFHLFPNILPEMGRGNKNAAAEKDARPGWEQERAKMLEQTKDPSERLLPVPDAARLLPHGYLRRRLAGGRFIAMERLGGVIVTNNAAAEAASVANRPSVEELSGLFGSSSSDKDVSAEPGETKRETKAANAARVDTVERPYPGMEAESLRADPDPDGDSARTPAPPGGGAPAGDVAAPNAAARLNKYPPSAKLEARPAADAEVKRSVYSAPAAPASVAGSAGSAGSGAPKASAAALSPAADEFEPARGEGEGEGDAKAAFSSAERDAKEASPAGAKEEPEGGKEDLSEPSSAPAGSSAKYVTLTGEEVALNKYPPSAKRTASAATEAASVMARRAESAPAPRSEHKTTEAELASLVAHCVRHSEKATPGAGRGTGGKGAGSGGGEDTLPPGIKDVLRRLTRETFSDNTYLVTIERVRGIGGNLGGEARHNSQMMVVSKLLNDLATRRHKAMAHAPAA